MRPLLESMNRHHLGRSDNAQLPETYPAVKCPSRVSPSVGKRKERPATVELRVSGLAVTFLPRILSTCCRLQVRLPLHTST